LIIEPCETVVRPKFVFVKYSNLTIGKCIKDGGASYTSTLHIHATSI